VPGTFVTVSEILIFIYRLCGGHCPQGSSGSFAAIGEIYVKQGCLSAFLINVY